MSWRDKIAAVLAGKVGGPTPSGIHVYHSSPHDFDKFDLAKIGTGEGAQMYGHGIYAAENPAVSGQGGQYWKQFSDRYPLDEASAAAAMFDTGFDREKAIEHARRLASEAKPDTPIARQRLNALRLLESGAPVGPRTYEVNFRAKPEELLDWDKPLAQQPAGPAAWNVAKKWLFGSPEKMTGEEAYRGIAAIEDKPRASNVFRDEAGIPGIRYLDEGSRNAAGDVAYLTEKYGSREKALEVAQQRAQNKDFPGHDLDYWKRISQTLSSPLTHNYVAFDPSKLDIMAKYGVVGGVPLGAATMGGTIDQSSYGVRQ